MTTTITALREVSSDTDEPKIRDVYGDPETTSDYHEDDWDQEWPPESTSVGWDLSFGCALTFARNAEDEFGVTVNTSGADQRNGVTVRRLDREQLVDYARQLLALAEEDITNV